MQLNITFRGFGATDALKEHARDRVERVNKYLDRAGDAHVVLSLERHLHHADITIHSGAWVLRGKDKSEDMYTSIELAMDKIERQLRRYKERLKHHHGKDRVHHRQDLVNHLKIRHNVLEAPDQEAELAREPLPVGPRIIRTNEFLARPMSIDEAVMQMDLMNNEFLVFTNVQTKEMCVVYRRNDGHYGLIEAAAARDPGNDGTT
jgi:putative sigma-54 modulation protein